MLRSNQLLMGSLFTVQLSLLDSYPCNTYTLPNRLISTFDSVILSKINGYMEWTRNTMALLIFFILSGLETQWHY